MEGHTMFRDGEWQEHKYVSRELGPDGKWVYTYDGPSSKSKGPRVTAYGSHSVKLSDIIAKLSKTRTSSSRSSGATSSVKPVTNAINTSPAVNPSIDWSKLRKVKNVGKETVTNILSLIGKNTVGELE